LGQGNEEGKGVEGVIRDLDDAEMNELPVWTNKYLLECNLILRDATSFEDKQPK
jgi:hypothetical protein